MKTLVIKFGGAAVASPTCFDHVAEIVKSKIEKKKRVVVVVSAMKGATDRLINLAKEVHPNPPKREYDMLVTVGERISISLLAMAMDKIGLQAKSFTGSQSGIITTASHSEARIIAVKPHRIEKSLNESQVAIVAGFQGVSEQNEITTLGRGGSDTTAVALAIALNRENFFSEVEFYKDVRGIYDRDPHLDETASKYDFLSYEEALKITLAGAKILHPRAIALAKDRVRLRIRSFIDLNDEGTVIGSDSYLKEETLFYESLDPRPYQISLKGLKVGQC